MSGRLLTVGQAGHRLAPLGYRVTDLLRRDQIGSVGVGSARRIPESEVERFEARS